MTITQFRLWKISLLDLFLLRDPQGANVIYFILSLPNNTIHVLTMCCQMGGGHFYIARKMNNVRLLWQDANFDVSLSTISEAQTVIKKLNHIKGFYSQSFTCGLINQFQYLFWEFPLIKAKLHRIFFSQDLNIKDI